MKWLTWILARWYIPVIALLGLLAFWLGIRRNSTEGVARELKAIETIERARAIAIDEGAERAIAEVDREYRDTIRNLDKAQARALRQLAGDPARRVRFLNRVARKRGGSG